MTKKPLVIDLEKPKQYVYRVEITQPRDNDAMAKKYSLVVGGSTEEIISAITEVYGEDSVIEALHRSAIDEILITGGIK